MYLIIGALAKSTVVIALAWLSYDTLRQDIAPWVALIAVAVVILVSIVASVIYKRKTGIGGGTPRSQS
jgi:hypothetical protein